MIPPFALFEQSFDRNHYDLKKEFDALNKEMFGGSLKPIPLKWTKSKDYLGQVTITEKSNGARSVKVLLMSDFYSLTPTVFRDTLAHELIHVYITQNNIKDDAHHGVEFTKIMNQMNARGFNIEVLKDHGCEIAGTTPRKKLTVILRTQRVTQGGKTTEDVSVAVVRNSPKLLDDLGLWYSSGFRNMFSKNKPKDPPQETNHFIVYETTADVYQSVPVSRSSETLKWYEITPEMISDLKKTGKVLGETTVT